MSTAGVRLAPQRNGAKESGLARFGPAQASGMHVRKKRRPAPVGMTAGSWRLLQVRDDGYVEFRIVLFHVAGTVLGAEFLDHGRDLFGVSDGNRSEFGCVAARIDSERRVLEHILVPLCVRPAHR